MWARKDPPFYSYGRCIVIRGFWSFCSNNCVSNLCLCRKGKITFVQGEGSIVTHAWQVHRKYLKRLSQLTLGIPVSVLSIVTGLRAGESGFDCAHLHDIYIYFFFFRFCKTPSGAHPASVSVCICVYLLDKGHGARN